MSQTSYFFLLQRSICPFTWFSLFIPYAFVSLIMSLLQYKLWLHKRICICLPSLAFKLSEACMYTEHPDPPLRIAIPEKHDPLSRSAEAIHINKRQITSTYSLHTCTTIVLFLYLRAVCITSSLCALNSLSGWIWKQRYTNRSNLFWRLSTSPLFLYLAFKAVK